MRLCAVGCGRFRTISARRTGGFFPLLENDLASDAAGSAHDAAAGMRCGAAHVEIVDRRAVVGPSGNGTQEEKLFEREFTLKNVALREAKFAFEIERREDLAASD